MMAYVCYRYQCPWNVLINAFKYRLFNFCFESLEHGIFRVLRFVMRSTQYLLHYLSVIKKILIFLSLVSDKKTTVGHATGKKPWECDQSVYHSNTFSPASQPPTSNLQYSSMADSIPYFCSHTFGEKKHKCTERVIFQRKLEISLR